jgi:hypothetical protein
VDGIRHDVREAEDLESALVGDDRFLGTGGEPCRDGILARRRGVPSQPVQARADADEPTARPRVVGEERVAEPAAPGLGGREVPPLLRRDLEQPLVVRLPHVMLLSKDT